jgi:hypothetical protein
MNTIRNLSVRSNSRLQYVSWPLELQPGDEIFVANGLRVGPSKRKIRVEFLLSPEVQVVGPRQIRHNTFELPPNVNAQTLGLVFRALPTSTVPARKDIALAVTEIQISFRRMLVSIFVILGAIIPAVTNAWYVLFTPESTPELGKAAAVSIPVVLLASLAFLLERLVAAWQQFVLTDHEYEIPAESGGTSIGHIELKQNVSNRGVGEWTICCAEKESTVS